MPVCGWSTAWPFLVVWFAFKVAIWALLVSALVFGVRWLKGQSALRTPVTPLDILKARYARGEITKQDFESMRRDLDA